MTGLLQDCKHAFRLYRRTPIASALAVIVLAVAMAFVTAFLSMYVDLALRPHPGFEQSGKIVTIGATDGRSLSGLSAGLINQMAEDLRSVDAVSGVMTFSQRLNEGDDPLTFELVTRDFFAGMRPKLQAGRGFEPVEHEIDAAKVVIISHRYWQDVLDGADVIDTVIELEIEPMLRLASSDGGAEEEADDNSFQIVGIMAPEMTGTMTTRASLWLPFERMIQRLIQGPGTEQILTSWTMQTVARRGNGATSESVKSEIALRYSELPDEFRFQPGYRLEAIDGVVSNMNVHRDTERQLQLFLTASVLIALVAAANVSLFLLARAPGRRRELGIRMAVGAPLGRLARQLASESALLVFVGTAFGLVMSIWLGNLLRGLAFLRQASWRDVSLLDWRVLGLVGVFLLVMTLLVSLAPILGLKRLGIAASSRQVAARASFAQRFAGSLQIAIAGTLAGAAIAFGWYLGSLTLGYPGYEYENRYVVQFTRSGSNIDAARYRELLQSAIVDIARRREAIEGIPGVSRVAFGQPIPGLGQWSRTNLLDPNDPEKEIQLRLGYIDTRYVDVLGLRLLHGRTLVESDSNAILVNRALARTFFGRDDVVGETFPFGQVRQSGNTIVGVLEDLSFEHPSAEVEPIMFSRLSSTLTGTAIVESSLTAAALQQELDRITAGGELEVRVGQLRPMSGLRETLLAADRARSWLTIGAAVLVVILAAFGFYGTQRYIVTAGRREYAIRASLGAGPASLRRLVLVRGLLLGVPGLAAGALLAFIAVAWLRDEFVSREVSPMLVTFIVIAGLVLLLFAASFGPARIAMRTQPAPLLKEA